MIFKSLKIENIFSTIEKVIHIIYVCIYKFNKYFLNQQTVVYKNKLINVTSSTRPLVHNIIYYILKFT